MRVARLLTVPLVVTAVAGGLVATATPAAAGGAPPAPFVVTPAGPQRDANATASVAGYVAALGTADRHSIVGSFTVPAVTCRARTQAPLFVSLGMSGTAADSSFDYAYAGLTVSCTQGVPYYSVDATTNPDRQVGAVSPGDQLAVRITVTSTYSIVSITDTTSGGVFRSQGNGIALNAAQASVQGGFEGQTFPRFQRVDFKGIRIDGAALATFTPAVYDQAGSDDRLYLTTSALTAQQAFVIRYVGQP